jgi:DNA-binding transcriptional regulator YiaG
MSNMSNDIPELTEKELASAVPAKLRKRFAQGKFESGEDVAALRRFIRLTQEQFARALGISVHTLRNWEQGRRVPDGPAIALLRIAAKHPRIIRKSIESAA